MKARSIQLRQEVFETDAWKIADWLDDHEVIQYLNEGQNVVKSIKQVIQRVNMPVLTHLFNQNGSFFIIIEEKIIIRIKGNQGQRYIVLQIRHNMLKQFYLRARVQLAIILLHC